MKKTYNVQKVTVNKDGVYEIKFHLPFRASIWKRIYIVLKRWAKFMKGIL